MSRENNDTAALGFLLVLILVPALWTLVRNWLKNRNA